MDRELGTVMQLSSGVAVRDVGIGSTTGHFLVHVLGAVRDA